MAKAGINLKLIAFINNLSPTMIEQRFPNFLASH